jgi:hypothetical protein
MIPTIHKKFTGDKAKGAHYLGLAQRQLNILLREMALSPNKSVKDGSRKLKLGGGAFVQADVCYNIYNILIHIPYGFDEKKEQKKLYQECFCNCSFSTGYIIGQSADNDDPEFINQPYPDENRRYDVIACTKKEQYRLYKYCLPSDHTDLLVEAGNYGLDDIAGMPVVLFLDNTRPDADKCCPYRPDRNLTQTACDPDTSIVYDAPWDEVPIFRIIPIYLTSAMRWMETLVEQRFDVGGRSPNGIKIDTP